MSQTCSHIYDTGSICQSFAVRGQRYCVHHLRFRARRLRAAQARARGERFEFNLPPLESMHDVHSALSQLAEAIAAGVIDSRSAHLLLSVFRVASRNLSQPEKWRDSLYHSDQPAPDIDVAAEYGLPADTDFDAPIATVILSESRSDESKDPLVANAPTAPPELPFSGNYCGTHHSRECECCRIRPDYPITPELIEYTELRDSQGPRRGLCSRQTTGAQSRASPPQQPAQALRSHRPRTQHASRSREDRRTHNRRAPIWSAFGRRRRSQASRF